MWNLSRRTSITILSIATLICGVFAAPLIAQDAKPKPSQIPVVSKEVKSVDPATLVHPQLAQKVTIEFEETTLADIGDWLTKTTGLPVFFDEEELANEGISLKDTFSDRLVDAPIYLLLDRLGDDRLDLGWYLDDEIVHITTYIYVSDTHSTKVYSVGELLNKGFNKKELISVIQEMTSGPWVDIHQDGGDLNLLGETLIVRQTPPVQREVSALLSALRNHGRDTFSLDYPIHSLIRARLQEKSSVNFENMPLSVVAETLTEQLGFEVRLDEIEFSNEGISADDEVSLAIENRKLGTLLKVLLKPLALTAIPTDGMLLVTTEISASEYLNTVVYDVSDLCRDESEAHALMVTIQDQTVGPWLNLDQEGGDIAVAKPDTLVIRQTEETLTEVREFLKAYREKRNPETANQLPTLGEEVITVYYKLDTEIAEQLKSKIWELVSIDQEELWKVENGLQIGKVVLLPSTAILRSNVENRLPPEVAKKFERPDTEKTVVPQSTLVITHRRRVHYEIYKAIERIRKGDKLIKSTSGLSFEYTRVVAGIGFMGGGSGCMWDFNYVGHVVEGGTIANQ